MWWRILLATLGIAYEILKCVLCGAEAARRKGGDAPPGWTTCKSGWLCSRCGP